MSEWLRYSLEEALAPMVFFRCTLRLFPLASKVLLITSKHALGPAKRLNNSEPPTHYHHRDTHTPLPARGARTGTKEQRSQHNLDPLLSHARPRRKRSWPAPPFGEGLGAAAEAVSIVPPRNR